MENNKIKCEQYWPESGKKQFGPFTVAITDQQILADYTIRTLEASVSYNTLALYKRMVGLLSASLPLPLVGWKPPCAESQAIPFHCLA